MRSRLVHHFTRLMYLLLALLAFACARAPTAALRVCTNQWPGYEPLYLARTLGHHDRKDIQLVEYASATDCMRAIGNGSVEAAALTLDEALQLVEEGVALKVVLVMDYSWGADSLMAQPRLANLAMLKGQRIGVETSAVGSYMLHKSLRHAGLVTKDVRIVPLAVNRHLRAYSENFVDAVITFEPTRSRLLKLGAQELFSSRDIPGEILDVLVVRREDAARVEFRLQNLIDSWFKALAYLEKQPQAAAERMAPRVNLTAPEFLATLERLHLLTPAENAQLLKSQNPKIAAIIGALNQTMVEAGLMRKAVAPESLL